jgi:hypothetical protein
MAQVKEKTSALICLKLLNNIKNKHRRTKP